MKNLSILIFLLLSINPVIAQGRVEQKKFVAPSIQGNPGGEDPERKLEIYLPPGYDKSTARYPVLYFLHGFAVDAPEMMEWIKFKELLDSAISKGSIRPVIFVLPSSLTKYYGSFYTNSEVTGNWADFIGKDVVEYMDRNYRTIPHRDSRGLFGHSMGGTGALKLAMLYADKFSTVYSMSAGGLDFTDDLGLSHPAFKRVFFQKNPDSLRTAVPYYDFKKFPFYEMLFISMARTYSPNRNNKLIQADLPVRYEGDKLVVDEKAFKKWQGNFPINMISNHLGALKSLRALKMDWGRNEDFRHIPASNLQFSKKLEIMGVEHFAEEYIGDHVNKLEGFEGRIFTEVFPFFERYLK